MELSSICKVFTSIMLIGSLIACKEDNKESTSSHVPAEEISACQASLASIQAVPNDELPTRTISANSPQNFGENSAADFYLASGEVGFLEDREYNFNNIYLESNSIINISEQANTNSAFIKIHALGSCDLNGVFNIEGYKGTLEIRCDGQFNTGGVINVSSSSVSSSIIELRSNGILITKLETLSGEDNDAGSGVIISNGDDLDGDGLIDTGLPTIVIVDSFNSDDTSLDLTINENPTVIELDTVAFYPCTI